MACKRHKWEFIGRENDPDYGHYELKWCANCGALSEWFIKGNNKSQRIDIRLPGEKRESLKEQG